MSTPPKRASLVPQPEGTRPDEVMHISSFAVVKKGNQILLLRRIRPEAQKGAWCLPAAVISYGEDPGHSALRIVREQIGASPTAMKLIDVQSFGDKHWDLCFVFHFEIPGVTKLGDDFDKSDWFDLTKLPPELREGHREVIDAAKARKAL